MSFSKIVGYLIESYALKIAGGVGAVIVAHTAWTSLESTLGATSAVSKALGGS